MAFHYLHNYVNSPSRPCGTWHAVARIAFCPGSMACLDGAEHPSFRIIHILLGEPFLIRSHWKLRFAKPEGMSIDSPALILSKNYGVSWDQKSAKIVKIGQEGSFLKWHICRAKFGTKNVFGATNFLTKNAPKFSPESFEPLFCGSEKIPQNSPPNFPLKKQDNFTDELLQARRERSFKGGFRFTVKVLRLYT